MQAQDKQVGIMGLCLIDNRSVRVTRDHRTCDHLTRRSQGSDVPIQPVRHVFHAVSQHVVRQVIVNKGHDPARQTKFRAQLKCPLDGPA